MEKILWRSQRRSSAVHCVGRCWVFVGSVMSQLGQLVSLSRVELPGAFGQCRSHVVTRLESAVSLSRWQGDNIFGVLEMW